MKLINDDADVVSMCKLHAEWPIDTIILYMESDHAPFEVEVPRGLGGGEDGGVGRGDDGDGQLENDDDSVMVEEPHGAATAVEEEFNWLNEGLEGEDFDDDVFGVPSPPYSVPPEPSNDPPQPTTVTSQANTNTPPTNTDTPQPNTVPPSYIDVDEVWVELALKDDITSMDGFDDE